MPRRENQRDRDLRRLKRRDLLELLEELSRENDRLRAELDEANRKLKSRDLALSKCGTLAEASLALSGVFQAADEAARTYVEQVERAADEGRLERGPAEPGPASERERAAGSKDVDDIAGEVRRRVLEKSGKRHKKHKGKK